MLGLDSLLGIQVSTGARYSQDVSEVASSVTIVTAEDIARYGYRTLDEVLAAAHVAVGGGFRAAEGAAGAVRVDADNAGTRCDREARVGERPSADAQIQERADRPAARPAARAAAWI